MKKENAGFSTKVDLIELSDAFRRHAKFDNPRIVKGLVEHSRALLCLLSQYRPEYPDLPENRNVKEALICRVLYMSGIASAAEIDEIVLPIADNRQSDFNNFFRREILQNVSSLSPVKLSLQKDFYRPDNSGLGPVDKKIRTVFDAGLRAFMNITPR